MIRRYSQEDYEAVSSWYGTHEMMPIPIPSTPEIGLIEPDVAAGFLLRTDTDIAILDGFVTNKKANQKQKEAALDEIITGLTGLGKLIGYKRFFGFTQVPGMKKRVMRHGFKKTGNYSFFLKEIN